MGLNSDGVKTVSVGTEFEAAEEVNVGGSKSRNGGRRDTHKNTKRKKQGLSQRAMKRNSEVGSGRKKKTKDRAEDTHSLTGISISDSNIRWRNWVLRNKDPHEVAKAIREFGKTLGLSSSGNED